MAVGVWSLLRHAPSCGTMPCHVVPCHVMLGKAHFFSFSKNVSELRLSGSRRNVLLLFYSSFMARTAQVTLGGVWGMGVSGLPVQGRRYIFISAAS